MIIILYKYIDRHAQTPNKTKTKDTISLNYNTLCYITPFNRNGWVSMKGIYKHRCRRDTRRLSNTYLKKNQNAPRPSEHPPVRGKKMSKLLSRVFKKNKQNTPSNLLVYSTIQCSTIVIILYVMSRAIPPYIMS